MNKYWMSRLWEEGDVVGDVGGGDAPVAPAFDESSSMISDMLEFRGDNSGGTDTTAPVVPVASPATPSPAPVTPTVVPATPIAPSPVSAPAPAIVAQPSPTPPATPTTAPTPQQYAPDPGEQSRNYHAVREAAIPQIASRYQFTPEQKLQLLTSPEDVLPTMAARIMVDAYESAVNVITQMLPQLVSNISQESAVVRERENEFWQVNPDLRNQPVDVITQIARTYIQLNPQVSSERANREIGALTRSMLGLAPITVAAPSVPAPAAPSPIVARTSLGSAVMGAPPTNGQDAIIADMLGWRR